MKMTKSDHREEVIAKAKDYLQRVRKNADQLLYYTESEDLQRREEKKGGWSIAEIFYHINLVNGHYLEQLPARDEQVKPAQNSKLPSTFLGRMLFRSLHPDERSGFSGAVKSPAKTDPLKRQEKGYAVVEGVVFREFVGDMDELQRHLENMESKAYEDLRVATLFPLLKISGSDAVRSMLVHTERHLRQARRLLE